MKSNEIYRSSAYGPYMVFFEQQLLNALLDYGMKNIDCSQILERMGLTLGQLYFPNFITSYENWRHQKFHCDKYQFKYNNDTWNAHVKRQDPYLDVLAKDICIRAINYLRLLLFRVRSERNLLRKTFGIGKDETPSAIIILGADYHAISQQSALVTFGQHRLVYKVWDSGIESVINKICHISGMAPVCPLTLNCKTHVWQQYILNRPLSSKSAASRTYKKYGHILSLIQQLNISDCFFDGFISDVDSVYFINPESSFQSFFKGEKSYERSLNLSGLLSNPAGPPHTGEWNVQHSVTTNVFHSFEGFSDEQKVDDRAMLCRGYATRIKSQNYPHIPGKRIRFDCYTQEIISGYEEGYTRLREHRWEIIDLLDDTLYINPRYHIRSSLYYLSAINNILHDVPFRGSSKRSKKYSGRLVLREAGYHQPAGFLSYEEKCLSRYDVPLFHIDIHSRSLFNGDGDENKNFFTHTPMEQIRSNFYRSEDYCRTKRKLIAMAMRLNV